MCIRDSLKPIKLTKNIDINFLARQTPGFSGADIANVCNEAALIAARKSKKQVEKQDFLDAVDRIIGGLEKKSKIISPNEKKTIAYHEAGHAIVAIRTEGADPVHKVTIIPRGRALGVTMQLPMDEKHGYSKPYVDGRLAILMGGRAAEMLIFDKMTTGAGNDIEQATQIARKMVTEWGMSDTLGPMTFGKNNDEVFLGRDIQSQRDYSEVTARMIDEEIAKIIRIAQKKSEKILNDNKELLHTMASSLLKHETIDSKDIQKILDGKTIVRRKPSLKSSKPTNGKIKKTRVVDSIEKKANGKL